LLAYDINVACSASLEITRTLRSFVLLSLELVRLATRP
jgi:hypothetical protein